MKFKFNIKINKISKGFLLTKTILKRWKKDLEWSLSFNIKISSICLQNWRYPVFNQTTNSLILGLSLEKLPYYITLLIIPIFGWSKTVRLFSSYWTNMTVWIFSTHFIDWISVRIFMYHNKRFLIEDVNNFALSVSNHENIFISYNSNRTICKQKLW